MMTDEIIMPEISVYAAFLLLKFLTDQTSGSKANADINKLQACCMSTISTSRAEVADAKARKSKEEDSHTKGPRFKKVKKDGSDLPNGLQIELLGSCLQNAKKDLDKAHETINVLLQKRDYYGDSSEE